MVAARSAPNSASADGADALARCDAAVVVEVAAVDVGTRTAEGGRVARRAKAMAVAARVATAIAGVGRRGGIARDAARGRSADTPAADDRASGAAPGLATVHYDQDTGRQGHVSGALRGHEKLLRAFLTLVEGDVGASLEVELALEVLDRVRFSIGAIVGCVAEGPVGPARPAPSLVPRC